MEGRSGGKEGGVEWREWCGERRESEEEGRKGGRMGGTERTGNGSRNMEEENRIKAEKKGKGKEKFIKL